MRSYLDLSVYDYESSEMGFKSLVKDRPIRNTTSKRITQCVEFEFWSRTRFPGWYLVFSDDIWSDNTESILLVFSVSSSVMSRGLRDCMAILW